MILTPNKTAITVTCIQEEVYKVNQAIQTLKELIKENCQDLELYKMVIEQDLQYLT